MPAHYTEMGDAVHMGAPMYSSSALLLVLYQMLRRQPLWYHELQEHTVATRRPHVLPRACAPRAVVPHAVYLWRFWQPADYTAS